MKKIFLTLACIISCSSLFAQAKQSPDTVFTGFYITSIHDIDFREKEYTIDLWLWLKYRNPAFNFEQNLEVPQAKTVTKSFATKDTTDDGRIYLLMKLQCVMKDSWRISRFPFDRQKLRFSIENSQFDSHSLIFKEEKGGSRYDPRFTISNWNIDSLTTVTRIKSYETDFGDESLKRPHSDYSSFYVTFTMERHALDLFWKLFLGMYVAFLIAFVSFYIHCDSIDSRFTLSVGSVFAVVGNKYIVDSALPESTSFTLVDTLHGLTLLFIFVIIVSSVYSLTLVKKKDDITRANRFDRISSIIIFVAYVTLNAWFIMRAVRQ